MSWQQELQQLDMALAAGQVSADEYRKRRDQLFAQASGEQDQGAGQQQPAQQQPPQQPQQQVQPQGQPPAEQQPAQQPPDPQPGGAGQPQVHPQGQQPPGQQPSGPQPQPGGSPFPPAFRWQRQEGAEQSDSSATHVMRPVAGPDQAAGPAERTQAVQPGDADRTQVVQEGGERTQVVRGYPGGPGTPPPGFPPPYQQQRPPQQHPQQPWSSQPPPGDFSPPWGNENDLPPNFGNATWLRQGPEVFNDSSSGKRSKVLIIVAAVVVVLLIGGGVYYFTSRPGAPEAQGGGGGGATTTAPHPTTKPPKPTPTGPQLPQGPFVALPGTPNNGRGQNVSIDTAVQAQVPSSAEAPQLKRDGVTSIGFIVTKEGELTRGEWAFTPSPSTDPKKLLDDVNSTYLHAGYQKMSGMVTGVTGLTIPPSSASPGGVFRAHYITDGVVVRIEAYGPDPDAAKQAFLQLLQKETSAFPPTP